MPILIDYNQIILSSLFVSIGNHTNMPVEESMIRHMFLNSVRSIRKKYSAEFGELVICTDGKYSWRKDVFPYYKANRKVTRDESELNWDDLFEIINKIRTEVAEVFPYKLIHIDKVEADDIIGVICNTYGTPLAGGEKFLVYSRDHDFIQLQVHGNVKQINPITKKYITENDPIRYLKEHIIKGDSGDGIPNILSPDNCLVIKEKQKSITEKRLSMLLNVDNMDEHTKIKYFRNKMLIDFSEIPEYYQQRILEEYEKEPIGSRNKMRKYFLENRLQNLLPLIGDF